MQPRLALASLLVAFSGLGACQDTPLVTVDDDLDLHLDFNPMNNGLKSPYVQGTDVRVFAHAEDGRDDDWRITSQDPTVFLADAVAPGETSFHANGPGKTRLFATRGRDSVRLGEIEVGVPTRIALFAHGPILVRRNDPALPPIIQTVVGHETTFLVRYLRNGTELHGNGVLSVETDDNLIATPRTTFFFENREWLTIQPMALGTHELKLFADGILINTVTVRAVPEEAVEALTLARESERGAGKGQSIHVLAEGFDLDGAPVLGVDPTWDLDGVAQFGTGDLFIYHFDASQRRQLFARFGGAASAIMVHTGEGFVSSSNIIGCAGAGGSESLAWSTLGLAALVVMRRRRA